MTAVSNLIFKIRPGGPNNDGIAVVASGRYFSAGSSTISGE
jgi:hypothetical protein